MVPGSLLRTYLWEHTNQRKPGPSHNTSKTGEGKSILFPRQYQSQDLHGG